MKQGLFPPQIPSLLTYSVECSAEGAEVFALAFRAALEIDGRRLGGMMGASSCVGLTARCPKVIASEKPTAATAAIIRTAVMVRMLDTRVRFRTEVKDNGCTPYELELLLAAERVSDQRGLS